MKKLTIAALALVMLTACGPKVTTGTAETQLDSSKITCEVTLEDGKVTEITIDETQGDSTKRTLGDNYGMKGTSANIGRIDGGAEWYEQVDNLQNYIIANGVDAVTLDDAGYITDATIGCTINVYNIMATVNAAIENAK